MVLLCGRVPSHVCAHWLDFIERRYAAVKAEDPEFFPHSSSLRLRAIDGLPIEDVLHELLDADLLQRLGPLTACDVNQCWVRRQYALHDAPPHHAPHSWHQDGALNFDFMAHSGASLPDDALLDMLTCWIPLTPCGVDAPGLELMREPVARLLAPAELTPDRVRNRYPAASFERPAMNPGDALLLPIYV